MKKRRVLYYNWCPLSEKVGGGIAVYQKNLWNYLRKADSNLEIFFLHSGFLYDTEKKSYIRQESPDEPVFAIVNSPVYAPIQTPLDNIRRMMENKELTDLVATFLEEKGPFDVIHFQTLEGLPLSVLRLKEKFPHTKFIYSLHNYMLFCPNVQLWTCQGKNCLSDKKFDCASCMRKYARPSLRMLKHFRRWLTAGKRKCYLLSRVYAHLLYRFPQRQSLPQRDAAQEEIAAFRHACIEQVNRYADAVLAVSERVREIALFFGLNPQLVRTSYIGTKFAESATYRGKGERSEGEPLRLVYLGYMRREKGFYFFMEALRKMDPSLAGNISLTFASRIQDPIAYIRMKCLKRKFHDVTVYNGFTHENIREILAKSDLGVVPVLWEDNLPQVAIEMIANGIPVLASDFGGPSELNGNPHFKHRGADSEDFLRKLEYIYRHPELLGEYWKTAKKLTSMEEHVHDLKKVYGANDEE